MELPAYPTTSDLAKAIGGDYHVAKEAHRIKRMKFNSGEILNSIASKYLIYRPDLSKSQELVAIVSRIWRQNKKKKK